MTLTAETSMRIRRDLIAGIDRSITRRRKRRRIAIGMPIAVLAVTVGLLAQTSSSDPAFAVYAQTANEVRVEIYPTFEEVDELQAELRSLGLDVTVVHLRGHPSLDGHIEVVSHANETNGAIEFDGNEFVLDTSRVEGQIEVLIYSAAEPGQSYQFAPSAFAVGQPLAGLHCAYDQEPLTTQEFAARAAAVGLLRFEWVAFDGPGPEASAAVSDERPTGVVVDASLKDEDTVRVIVLPDSTVAAADAILMSDGSHDRNPGTCTPELAAAWD